MIDFFVDKFVHGILIFGIVGAFLLRFAMKNPSQAGGIAKILWAFFRK